MPIALPGVNLATHLPLVERQRRARGWKGFVVPGPNCTTVGLAISLKPLLDAFGLRRVLMTSMQGISGAGRSPGVLALDIVDNLVPYIPKEEEKVAAETQRIADIKSRKALRPGWLDGALRAAGVIKEGETL